MDSTVLKSLPTDGANCKWDFFYLIKERQVNTDKSYSLDWIRTNTKSLTQLNPTKQTRTQTIRWTWSTQWGLTYNPLMILLVFHIQKNWFKNRKMLLSVFLSRLIIIKSRNPSIIAPYSIYILLSLKIFLFLSLILLFLFFCVPLMPAIYSSMVSFIPHLICDNLDINPIFCLHLMLLILT
jgi:hypothetical protein